MPPAFLLKELPTIIGIVAIAAVVWLIGHGIHENGRKVERVIWQEKENKLMAAQAKELGEAMERVAAKNRHDLNHTMGVINEKDRAIAKLEDDMRIQRANSRGMFISAKACSDKSAVPGKADSSGQSGAADYVRLPADVEQRIREIGQRAQETVISHNACVAELKNLVNVAADFK